jgi:hypothetical protein
MMGVDINKAINRAVFNGFRKKGLYLKADAAKYLVETLAELGSKEDIEQTIREVADAIDKENGTDILAMIVFKFVYSPCWPAFLIFGMP